MLISHRKKFIFTKTVKTASTSVEAFFEKYCMRENEWQLSHERAEYVSEAGIIGVRLPKSGNEGTSGWYNHMPAKLIREKIGNSIWEDYLKFTTIRNPFQKVLSFFFYRCVRKMNVVSSEKELITLFRSWIQHRDNLIIDRDKYMIDNHICIDIFIKFENLHFDMKKVCGILRIPFQADDIPKFKSGHRLLNIKDFEFYDRKSIELILSVYSLEFELFNYSTDFYSYY
jgi:hypothetical protein